MGQNSALKARIKHAKKNTRIGRKLARFTKDLRRGKKNVK